MDLRISRIATLVATACLFCAGCAQRALGSASPDFATAAAAAPAIAARRCERVDLAAAKSGHIVPEKLVGETTLCWAESSSADDYDGRYPKTGVPAAQPPC